MNLVIFGPPGAGKGTQSKFIVKKYNLHQISTGELLRNEIINRSQLGLDISTEINAGKLVSDKIVSDLIEKFITNKKVANFFQIRVIEHQPPRLQARLTTNPPFYY